MKKLTRAEVKPLNQKILITQKFKCPICGCSLQQGKKAYLEGSYRGLPCLDHCHDKGHVRGVLCNTCNTFEGKVRQAGLRYGRGKENYIDSIIKLAAYLHRNREPVYQYIHPEHKTEDDKRLARNKKARLNRANKKVV